MKNFPYGFRIVGGCSEKRRPTDWAAAFRAHASCDDRAQLERESYLSAFQFGEDFRQHMEVTGSTKNYTGPCGADWLWFDIDCPNDLSAALRDARKLARLLLQRYEILPDCLLIFFSGGKGFHIGVPTALWRPKPGTDFHRIARYFAKAIAELAGVTIDSLVYDKVRAFRAPNSRHPKTGLHKRHFSLEQLSTLDVPTILKLSSVPEQFSIPDPNLISRPAESDWEAAQLQLLAAQPVCRSRTPSLNRATLQFIREGAAQGQRANQLFQAARNLGDFGCSFELAMALLSEAGLDSGLRPSEVRRQIECGIAAGNRLLMLPSYSEPLTTTAEGQAPGRQRAIVLPVWSSADDANLVPSLSTATNFNNAELGKEASDAKR